MKTAVLWLGALVSVLVCSCSSKDEKPVPGKRGETCEAHGDCESGLYCLGGRCMDGKNPLSPNDRVCAAVECVDDANCCVPGARCDAICENNQCVTECSGDGGSDCLGSTSGRYCSSKGYCVECLKDSDCSLSNGGKCVDNQCKAGCENSAQCAAFYACEDNECVFRGCENDRECAAYYKDPRGVCRDSKCQVSCETDFECDRAGDGSRVCRDKVCKDVGCETDTECRLRHSDGGAVSGIQYVCKEAE